MPGLPENALGNDSESDQRDGIGPSSPHTRSNSVTFDSQESPTRRTASPSYRHSAHYQRASHSASRHSSSGGLSPSKLPRSAPMNDANGDAPRPKSGKKSEHTRRRRRTRNSGTKRDTRAIDYGLGLLDDPFFLDPSAKARIAELQSRVENINPIAVPAVDTDSKPAPHDPPRTPPPREPVVSVQPPPRLELPNRISSPHPSSSTSQDGQQQLLMQRGPSQRRRINSMFAEVKEKFAGKSSGKHPVSNPSLVDPNRVVSELRAEARIQRYREDMSASTLERANATKSQLELRYFLVFDALAKHEPPPNLLSVIRWRRDISSSRRRDARHLAMTEMMDVPHDNTTHAPGSASPGVATTWNEPTSYASEAASLQWLPHLSSLHSRFLHPSGRRDMKEWYITAQVLKDYVLHGSAPVVQNPPSSASPDDRPTRSMASSPLPPHRLDSRGASLEIQRPDPATELERFSSLEYDGPSRRTNSPNTSVKGYRISLTALGAVRSPRRVFSKSGGPTSPSEGDPASPVNATEFSFSPSGSRRDLSRKRGGGPASDDPVSSEMSMSEIATDMDGAFQRRGSARQGLQSASDEDISLRRDGRSRKPKLTPPVFSRKSTERRVAVLESASSPAIDADGEIGDSRRPSREAQSFTADLPDQFPRVGHDLRLASSNWEETQRIRRDHYARQEVVLHQLRVQNAHLDRANSELRAQITEFLRVRKLLSSELSSSEECITSDLIEAFEPLRGEYNHGYQSAEALNSHRLLCLRAVRRFIMEAREAQVPWLRPLNIPDPKQTIVAAKLDVDRLSTAWSHVQRKLEALGSVQDTLMSRMAKLNKNFEQTAVQIDTAYPELVRIVDLARQLSASSQTTLPYISTLPPWAREVLGPFIEYTLELIGFIIRWFLYPIWRLLPRWLQVIVGFIGVIVGSFLLLVITLLYKYWMHSFAFGHYLSRYRVFRSGVLFSIFLLNSAIDVYKRHWGTIFVSTSLISFWYLTTPQDLDSQDLDYLLL